MLQVRQWEVIGIIPEGVVNLRTDVEESPEACHGDEGDEARMVPWVYKLARDHARDDRVNCQHGRNELRVWEGEGDVPNLHQV